MSERAEHLRHSGTPNPAGHDWSVFITNEVLYQLSYAGALAPF